jgi:general transcription factor 3C polypeptide 3 (transcription factor C subunit 4)
VKWCVLIDFLRASDTEQTNSPPVWAKIAECNRYLGNLDVAVECYEAVLDAQPDDSDSRLQLAEIYEDLGNRVKALQLVNQGASKV